MNPLTFDRVRNETPYTLFGRQMSRVPERNVFRVDQFSEARRRVFNTYYDTRFLTDALRRITATPDTARDIDYEGLNRVLRRELTTGQEAVWVQRFGYRERQVRTSIVQTYTEEQRAKLSEHFGWLENALHGADDDWTIADAYHYSACWFILLILYEIRGNIPQIRDINVANMVERAITEFATLETYFATITDAVPLPAVVAQAVRDLGRDAVIESYMRGFGPRVTVTPVQAPPAPAPAEAVAETQA